VCDTFSVCKRAIYYVAIVVGESLYFDTMHIITEDWPLTENAKMFKAGERLVEVNK